MSDVEFTYLSTKAVGNDTVVFRLEDGAQLTVRVDLARAGSRVNDRGEIEYHFEFGHQVKVIPKDKKFKVRMPVPPQKSDQSYVK